MSRLRRAWRRGGVRGVSLAALGRTFYRHVVLIQRDLRPGDPRADCDLPIRVAPLEFRDLQAYSTLRPGKAADAARRIERGSVCYAAWHGDRIASVAWWHPGEAWIEDIDRSFALHSDEVYAYDAYTAPDLRGQGVAPARAAVTHAALRNRGFSRVVAFVVPENGPGLRSVTKSGWRRLGRAGYLSVGRWRIEFVRTTEGADLRARRWRPQTERDRPPPTEPTGRLG